MTDTTTSTQTRNPKAKTAKLFENEGHQAVRLPDEFRFDGDEVFAWRDEQTGDVFLSNRPNFATWTDFINSLGPEVDADDFMNERPMNVIPEDRGVFDDEIE